MYNTSQFSIDKVLYSKMYHLPRLRRNNLGLSKGLQTPEAKVDKWPFFTLKLTALNWLNYCISKSALTSSQTSHNFAFRKKPNPFEGKSTNFIEHFSECSFFLFSSGGICSFPKENVKYYILHSDIPSETYRSQGMVP